MVFGLTISSIALIVAIIFFVFGFFVKKFLKWAIILGVIALLVGVGSWII